MNPSTRQQYTASGPSSITLKANFYDAAVKVTDFLGLAMSGAQVKTTLANRTVVSGTTNGNGIFVAPQVPLGTFSASVSNLGSTAQITGDASKRAATGASLPLGTVSLGLVVAIVATLVGLAILVVRRRPRKATHPPTSDLAEG